MFVNVCVRACVRACVCVCVCVHACAACMCMCDVCSILRFWYLGYIPTLVLFLLSRIYDAPVYPAV